MPRLISTGERRDDEHAYHRGVHALAVVTAAALFPLILVGAGVTSKDAGMAYPDGITSDGYFWNPPAWWDRDHTRWEHGHRLLGRAAGLLAIALAAFSWSEGGWVRLMGLATLLAIVAQGVLGIFRVTEISRSLAMFHGIFAQVCFCIAATAALVTSRSWKEHARRVTVREAGALQRLCFTATGAIFLQLTSGALLRHFPSDAAAFVHVLMAVVVTLLVGWTALWVLGQHPVGTLLGKLGALLAVLMAVQLLLGGAAFLVTVIVPGGWSPFILWAVPSAHVAVGALLLMSAVLLTLCTHRMLAADETCVSMATLPAATS